ILQAALPFEHRPGVVADGGELGEDADEVHLAVAERAEAPGAIDPGLEARIDALPSGRIELRILDVERLDARRINVDEGEIVELLQQEVRGIIVDVAARMIADLLEEHLEGRAIEDVLARMDLVAEIDPGILVGIEDRRPAFAELR